MINLNGKWTLKELGSGKEYDATVPSCNFLDLTSNGVIKDPFVGTEEKNCQWVGKRDWSYYRSFDVDEELLASDKVYLVCKRLDTIATILINREAVRDTENCHIAYETEIKRYLRVGTNSIEIVFQSPVNYITKRKNKYNTPANPNGIDGIDHIRKPQCHFGWDWGPVLPESGITGDIFIEGRNAGHLEGFSVLQNHLENGKVVVKFTPEYELYSRDVKATLTAELTTPDGQSTGAELACGDDITFSFEVHNPKLWWPNGMTAAKEQPLYTCRMALVVDGKEVSSAQKKIGLRKIELDRGKDHFGTNFRFRVNGVDIFCKGANWIPEDSFTTRTDDKKLEYLIRSCVECNFNMLRIWGGGYYGEDRLYDLCDKCGILVWQDFAFACMTYPFYNQNFLANVQKEVVYNVKRLRDRASLAVWCGNNEIEAMSALWMTRKKSMRWNEEFFYHILPSWLKNLDAATPYIPSSPCGTSHLKDVASDNFGDTHLWAVWHGLQPLDYYRGRYTRFCSEFGFESLPDIKTIKTFATPQDYKLSSPVFNAHQKCKSGNKKMVYYIASRFNLPKKFEDYIYLSQICQSECVQDATEHWRRNRGRCNGSLFWQLDDCWPVCSWASIDYYGNFKCLQYRAKHFFAPVSVSILDEEEKADVFVLNDTMEAVDGEVLFEVQTFAGKTIYTERANVRAESGAHRPVISFRYFKASPDKRVLRNCFMRATLFVGGEKVSVRTALFDKENKLSLPETRVSVKVAVQDDIAELALSSDKFARFVSINTTLTTEPFSDNFFDLAAGERKTVTLRVPKVTTREEVLASLTVTHLAEIKKGRSRLLQDITRLGIFLIPVNFFSYIYYKNFT